MPKTNFFQGLETLQIKGTIQLALTIGPDRVWTGTLFVAADNLTDAAVKKIPPLTFKGTSEELGEGFFDAIKTPMEKTSKLLVNVEAYEASVKGAEKAAKMNQTKTTTPAAKPPAKVDTKFQDKMKKVADLESKGKFGEAIGAMPKEADFPDKKDEIAAKLKALKAQRGGFDLFDTEATTTDLSSPADPGEKDPDEKDPDELDPDETDPAADDPFAATPVAEAEEE